MFDYWNYSALLGRCWENSSQVLLQQVLEEPLTVSYLQSLCVPGNIPRHSFESQSVTIHVGSNTGTLMRASSNGHPTRRAPKAQDHSKAQQRAASTRHHGFSIASVGIKSVREQPALKDETPLRRKGKENKRLLVQPKGTHRCHHRRGTSKPSKAPEKVTLGGRRWGIAPRARVSCCSLRTVPAGRV